MILSHDRWTSTKGSFDSATLHRPLGASEYAFFPASKDGVGDMFLHLAFSAPKTQVSPARVLNAWTLLRNRHPLLACKVALVVQEEEYSTSKDTPCFSFSPPQNVDQAREEAQNALFLRDSSRKELISNYMNGPRTLSSSFLSYLVLSSTPMLPPTESGADATMGEYDLLMCAPHFTGDGTSLHQCTHDLLTLLASPASDEDILSMLDLTDNWAERLPLSFEVRCAVPQSKFAQVATRVNFLKSRDREIGGHKFNRRQIAPQRTVFVERVFEEAQTRKILRNCKENGVTINHAIEVACSVAWTHVAQATHGSDTREAFKNPLMVYTAINLRPHLRPAPSDPTYWFLALTYFTLVLRSFPPTSQKAFWLRARSARAQTRRVVNSPFLVVCALEMAEERADRARGKPRPAFSLEKVLSPIPDSSSVINPRSLLPGPAPSTALLGLSLIGNLDTIYNRQIYPEFALHDVTTASRQKAGGILLLVHTFGGKLWLQMFYDENGFDGQVEEFWEGVGRAIEEYC